MESTYCYILIVVIVILFTEARRLINTHLGLRQNVMNEWEKETSEGWNNNSAAPFH